MREEQRIIDRYHENMRKNEQELNNVSAKERDLEEKEQEIFNFKRMFINCESPEIGYPAEVLQMDDIKKELQRVRNFEEEIFREVSLEERSFQEEHENLQMEKKELLSREDTYTEEYRKELNKLNGG